MKVSRIDVTLSAGSSGKQHRFIIEQQDDKLVFLTPDKREIATLSVSTMTKEVRDEEGDYHAKWSDDFYLSFNAVEAVAKRECDAIVMLGDGGR